MGIFEADCKVSDLTDDDMLQIMIAENAGQEKERFDAVLEAVAAVMARSALPTFTTANIAGDK